MIPQTQQEKALAQVLSNLLKGVKETNDKIIPNYAYMRTTKQDEWKDKQ